MGMIELLESRRLFDAGDLDTTFGINGHLDVPDLAADGDIAQITPVGNDQFLLHLKTGVKKINADGSPVTSFGDDGFAEDDFYTSKVVVQPDGKILLWGLNGPNTPTQTLLRLNADGSVDTSFGQQGMIDLKPALNLTNIQALVVQ